MLAPMLVFIQDIATPHNNLLIQAIAARGDTPQELWYCHEQHPKYAWAKNLTHAILPARLYKATGLDWRFILHILTLPRSARILLVGWMNPSTKLLFILLCLSRRPFSMWFDFPQEDRTRSTLQRMVRRTFFWLMRHSPIHVFCIGQLVVNYFQAKGIPAARLTNLPILGDTPSPKARAALTRKRPILRRQYGVGATQLLLVAGSRLVPDKGFDVLLQALAALTPKQRSRYVTVIVGKGPELDNLQAFAQAHKLNVTFVPWLDFAEFQALITAADLFIHPARFDAYGSTVVSTTLGIPTLGSTGAGAVVDLITHGQNGLTFAPGESAQLTEHLQAILTRPALLPHLTEQARTTNPLPTPAQAATTLLSNLA